MFNTKEKIKEIFSDNRRWFRIIWYWFVISFVVGAVAFFIKPDLLTTILEMFEERFGENPALNFNLAREIFYQNIQAAAIALFGGIILGIAPIAIVVVNGFLLGFIIISLLTITDGNIFNSASFIIGGIAPHGIFELPALMLAAAFGIKLGIEWIGESARGSRLRILGKNIIANFKIFVFIAAVLFLAAVIEVFVSGRIVDKIGQ